MAKTQRRYRTEQEIRSILSDWATSGEPAAGVATRHGVKRSQLYLWRDRYGGAGSPGAARKRGAVARRAPESRVPDSDRLASEFAAAVGKAVEEVVRQQVVRLVEQITRATREQVRRELLARLGTA